MDPLGAQVEVVGSLVVCRLEGEPTPQILEAIREAAIAHPGPCSVVVVVPPKAGPPGPPTREAAIATLRGLGGHISAWVVVLKGSVLRRAAFRAIVGSISLAARLPYPLVVFDSAARAHEWLALRGLSNASATAIESPTPRTG